MANLGRLAPLMRSSSSVVFCRCLSQTHTLSGKYNKAKQSKIQKKSEVFLNRRIADNTQRNKKTQWYDTPGGLSGGGGFGGTKRGPSDGSRRRAHQLSVVLSQYIISIINSGELDPRLPEIGVEIVRVKMIPDLGALHVYWLATGTTEDDNIQTILLEVSYRLRSLLTGLHVMNYLPPVVFIKDLSQARLQKVNELLTFADMGPEHEPTDLGANLKSDITLPQVNPTLSQNTFQEELDQISKNFAAADVGRMENIKTAPLLSDKSHPQESELNLRSDIYDLDHSALTQKIIQGKRRKITRGFDITDSVAEENTKAMPRLSSQDIRKMLTKPKVSEKRATSNRNLSSELYSSQSDATDYDEDYNEDDTDVDDEDLYKT